MKLLNKKNLQLNVQGLGYNLMSSQNGNILSQSQMIKMQSTTTNTHIASQQQSLTASAPLLQGQQSSILQQKLCFKDKMTKIIDGIYVGNYLSAMDQKNLIKENITHIINCSPSDCPNLFEQDFTYLNINIQDNWKTNLFLVIYIILDFLRNALQQNGRVLIHCNQGISRSPSIVIAYLIYTEKINANMALEKIKKKYPYADPNLDFQIQLNEMYKEVIEEDQIQRSRQSNMIGTYRAEQNQNTQSQIMNPPQNLNIITDCKKSKQIINSSSHITISTPDQPKQKINYDSYILKQVKSAHLIGVAQQNQINNQNGLLQSSVNNNVKIQVNTITANQIINSSIDLTNEQRNHSLLGQQQIQLNCFPPKNSPEQFFLRPDLQSLKNQQDFTLEQKQQFLFKRVHSQNTQNTDESDSDSPINTNTSSNMIENKYFLSQKIQKSSKDLTNEINSQVCSQDKKIQQESTTENESISSPPISAKQALQMSIHSQQENNCDENTEILVKSPSPIKKNNQKNNQGISIGQEDKDEDLKNKLSDSDIDPLDSTDIQDFNTDTSASFSFEVSSSFNNTKSFKTHNLSVNSSTNQSTSTQNSSISHAKYDSKHEPAINLACSVVSS